MDSWVRSFDEAACQAGAREQLERQLRRLLDAVGGSAAALYVDDGAGAQRDVVVGEADFPLRSPGGSQAPEEGLRRLELPGGHLVIVGGHADGDGRSVDGALAAEAAAAARARLLEQRLKRQSFEVNYRGVELEALYDVGLAIASTLNLKELSEEILLRAVSLLDARRGALYIAADGGYRLRRTFGGEARERVAFDDPALEELLASRPAEGQDLMEGAEHLLAVAIQVDGSPRGLLLMGDKESRHGVGPFGDGERRTLGLFANQAAIALENARLHQEALEKERLQREVELAADIQRRLMPAEIPRLAGLELLGWSRPARHVGGDWYDLRELAGGRLAAVVADVSGKGMPAALLVSTVCSALRLLLDGTAIGPDLAEHLNGHIFESSTSNKFITFLAADIDPKSGRVDYMNAGHNPALLLGATGDIEELPSGGMPLGLFERGRWEAGSLSMSPGDLLCLYSDGITEAESAEGEEFGVERLSGLLRETAGRPLDEIVEAADQAVSSFAAGQPQGDDQTLLLVRKA